ncbi:transcriptional regulator, AraC family [Lachnospiraceae bacterium KM106-2]|nr:transcriptional regulator, AraC family [Lachnospiraceae bacterium KM106-2]
MKNNQFQQALDYIEENIKQDISLYEIAGVAGYSVPQFYRLFKRVTGDTVGEYLMRRKMSKAAITLKETKQTIAEIAFQYGFESHDVFTRAFTRVYGMTPSKYRQEDYIIPPLKRIELGQRQQEKKDEKQMSFQELQMSGFQVVGMECRAKQWDADGSIGRLWSDFLGRVKEIEQISKPTILYGICESEDCSEESFVYMAAVKVEKVKNVPEGMTIRNIRSQKFFEASVPDRISTPDAYTSASLYAKSLSYEIDEYDDLEVYEDNFRDPDVHRFKLLIPIK